MEGEYDYRRIVENKNLIVMEHYCNDYYVVVNHMVVDLIMTTTMMMVVVVAVGVVADDHMDEEVMEVFDPYLNINESLNNKDEFNWILL